MYNIYNIACYNAVFVLPFAFDIRIVKRNYSNLVAPVPVTNQVLYLMNNIYTAQYESMYPGKERSYIIAIMLFC